MPYNSKPKFFYLKEKSKLFALIFLSLASLGLFQVEQRYIVSQEALFPNLDFRQTGKHWVGSRGNVYVSTRSPITLVLRNDGQRQTLMTQTLRKPHKFENIHVAVDLKFDAIEAGPAWWQKAGVLLLSYDQNGKRMTYWPSDVGFLSGTHDWRRYSAVIPTNETMKKMQLFVLHGGSSGELHLRNLQVKAAREAGWFHFTERALLIAWFGAAVWILLPLILQHRRNLLAYLSLATFLGMLSVSVLPQPLLSTTSKPALETIVTLATPSEKPAETQGEKKSGEKKPTSSAKVTEPEAESPEKPETKPAKRATIKVKSDHAQYAAHFLSHIFLALVVGLLDGLANAAGIGAGLVLLYGMFAVRQRITAA